MKSSVAVIGQGFVGGSLTTVFAEKGCNVYAFDKSGKYVKGSLPTHDNAANGYPGSITDLINDNECGSTPGFSCVYFVCVPTPMYEDGAADLRIVESVLNELAMTPGERIAVIKSTVPPGSTEKWNEKFRSSKLHIIFNPEFLTEANALNDMRNQNRIILGGPSPWIDKVDEIFQSIFPKVPIIKTSSTIAEAIKYFTNVQLAARVVLSCELKQICDALEKNGFDISYDKVLEYAKYDPRLGHSHMNVPGKDGIPGARGHCFPKDLNALISLSKSLSVNTMILDAIWRKNLELVPLEHRDWEKMIGRAISKKKD